MKKVVILLLTICMFALVGCGKSEAAVAVDEMILSIGEVSLDSIAQIEKAEKYYEALTDSQKEEVENYLVLMEARDTYDVMLEATKVTIELTSENFEEYFLVNIHASDLVQGSSHPLGGYNSSSANIHVEISPINADYQYEGVLVTMKLWEGFSKSIWDPAFKIDNPTISINKEGYGSFSGTAVTGGSDLRKATLPEMKLHSVVEIKGKVIYYSKEGQDL